MSEQIVDLRSIWAILRRHTRALAIAAAAGGLAGGALLLSLPAEYTSTTLVLFPPAAPAGVEVQGAQAIDTQVQIASSDVVLSRAGQQFRPPISAAEVAARIGIETPTDAVLTFTAKGQTAAQAEELATAVATADIDYLREAANSSSNDERAAMVKRRSTLSQSLSAVQGEITKTSDRLRREGGTSAPGKADATAIAQLTARQADLALQIDALDKQMAGQASNTVPADGPRLVGPASPAQRPPAVVRGGVFVGLGAAAALFLVAAFAALRGRREKTLRSRDQIADSIGVPVVASVQSRAPRSVAGWAALIRSYSPSSTEAWALRQLLKRSTTERPDVSAPRSGRRGRSQQEGASRPTRILVLTFSGDQPALSFGPQLASFAASNGTRTQLVVAYQRQDSSNSLQAAVARVGGAEQPRPGLFVDSHPGARVRGDLVVHSITVSRQRPVSSLAGADGDTTVLAVSSGGATAEDLARVALAADDAGVPLDGIVVTNADPLDRTTGRLLPRERAVLAPLPSLMTGNTGNGDPPVPAGTGRKR